MHLVLGEIQIESIIMNVVKQNMQLCELPFKHQPALRFCQLNFTASAHLDLVDSRSFKRAATRPTCRGVASRNIVECLINPELY